MVELRRWLNVEIDKKRKLSLCQANCKFIVNDEI